MAPDVLREDGRAPGSGSGRTDPGQAVLAAGTGWHRARGHPGQGDTARVSLLHPSRGHRAPSPCSRGGRTLSWSCHPGTARPLPWRVPLCPGPSLWPCPARTGDRGTGPPPLDVHVAAGPGSAPAPLAMAPPSLSLVTRVLGRVPGARRGRRSPGGRGGCPGRGSRGQAGLGRSPPRVPTLPRPRAGQGSARTHKYRQGQILPRSCEQPELLRTGSPSQGRSRGGRGAKVTRRNEGEPLRPESPRGERPDPPSACAKVGGRKTN